MEECLTLLEQAETLAAEAAEKRIDDTMTKREQAETLYRYLTEYVQYDRRYYSDRSNMPYDSQTAVGALRDGVAICGGYSLALKLLFEQADIPCYTATGLYGSEHHIWNIADLDGHWLWFDATADRGLSPNLNCAISLRKNWRSDIPGTAYNSAGFCPNNAYMKGGCPRRTAAFTITRKSTPAAHSLCRSAFSHSR